MPGQFSATSDLPHVTVATIQLVVGDFYGLTRDQLLSRCARRQVSAPRQIAMYLAKHLTRQSYPNLGRRFGDRDHTTVLHAVRKVASLRQSDPRVALHLDALTSELTTPAADAFRVGGRKRDFQ